jgi:type II secretory pathway component PulJ
MRRRSQDGATLIELLVATLLVSVAIVPLLQALPGTVAPAHVSDTVLRLSAAGTRKIEELTNRLRADINGVASGAEVCSDVVNCRAQWTITTDLSSATQGVGVLKSVTVIVCQDADANDVCDAGEDQVRYDTRITSRP